MARGRMIDKVICLSQKINTVSEGAENLYYRIYVNTDDFGRYHADPKILKGKVYTLRSISVATIEKRLNELMEVRGGDKTKDYGLIDIYESGGELYLEIMDFKEHQSFRKDYVRKHLFPMSGTDPNGVVRSRTESPSKLIKINIKKSKTIEAHREQIKSILLYFKEKTGKAFKTDPRNFISGRLNDGFTVEDCKKVIDVKTAQWLDDSENDKWLRPITLFRPANFEGYLNEKIPAEIKKEKISPRGKEFLERKD